MPRNIARYSWHKYTPIMAQYSVAPAPASTTLVDTKSFGFNKQQTTYVQFEYRLT